MYPHLSVVDTLQEKFPLFPTSTLTIVPDVDGKERGCNRGKRDRLVLLKGRMGKKRRELFLSLPNCKNLFSWEYSARKTKQKKPHSILNQIWTLIVSWEWIFFT